MKSQNLASAEKTSAFAALKIPQYRWLFAGNIAFFFAMQGQILTRSVLAWQLTQQEMALAHINRAVALPMLFGSLFGGAIADRVDKRKLVILGQSVILLNELVILYLLINGSLQFWNLLVAALCMGLMFPLIMPARMALSVKVVGRENITNAMALAAMVMNGTRVLGPVAAGVLIEFIGIEKVYGYGVVLYFIAILCMVRIDPAPAQENQQQKPLFADIKYGFTYLGENRQILLLLLFGLLPMFLTMPFQNLLVVFADEVWNAGERGFGILQGAVGVGGMIGTYWVAKRGEKPQRFFAMIGGCLAFGLLLALFSTIPNFYIALIPLLFANIFANMSSTLNHTAIQVLVPDDVRGRISSFMMMSFGLMPLGVLPMAFAAEKIGAPIAVTIASGIMVVGVLLFVIASPTLRRLDQDLIEMGKTIQGQKKISPLGLQGVVSQRN